MRETQTAASAEPARVHLSGTKEIIMLNVTYYHTIHVDVIFL